MKLKCAWVVAALLLSPVALAAGEADAPTVTGETGYFDLLTATTLPQGEWSFGLYYNNWDRLVLPDPQAVAPFSNEWDYDWHRLSASFGYGVTEDFEISVLVPYESFDASDNNRIGRINGRFFANEIDAEGLGNVRAAAKWRLWENGGNAFALNAFVDFATGDDDEGVVTGETGFGIGGAYQKDNWVVNFGYRDPGDPDNLEVPEEVRAGVGYAAPISDRFDWITELVGTIYVGDGPKSDDAIDLVTGGRIWFGDTERWAFNFALRSNLEHLSDTDEFCPIGGLIGLTYFPRTPTMYALTVNLAGDGNGRVSSDPLGIDCGGACVAEFRRDTVVNLTATPAADSTFEGFSGDCDSSGSVTMDEDKACTATFKLKPPPPPPPPPPPKVDPPPPPPPPPPVIEEVCYFAGNSARVDNRCKATLDEVALRMKNESERVALVIGHTDSAGPEASNQKMGLRRAQAVKDYLVTRHGIDPGRITTESSGESDPAGDNSTAEGRKQNRRAVIILKVM